MVALGFLQGLSAGLFLALVHFVCMYSYLPIVRWQQTGFQLRSNTVRPAQAVAILDVRGHHNISILSLQGYIMFGSAPQVSDALHSMLKRREECIARHAHDLGLHAPPWFIIADMRACKGIDFGGAAELIKLSNLVASRGGELRIAEPTAYIAAALAVASDGKLGPRFDSFEDELRTAEDAILAAHGAFQHLQHLSLSARVCDEWADRSGSLYAHALSPI